MQQFAPDPVPLEVTIKPSATDIAVIAAVLSGGSGTEPDTKSIEKAIDLWNRCAYALVTEDMQKCRREAVRKLLFKDQEEKISQGEFLKRLLPNDSTDKREDFLQEALERIPTTFVDNFKVGGPGWPTKGLAVLLDQDTGPAGLGVMKTFMEEMKGGVTLDLASKIGAFVLAWRELVSSPKYRGSVSQTKLKEKADIPTPQAEGGEPEGDTDSPGVDQPEPVAEGGLVSVAAPEESHADEEQTPRQRKRRENLKCPS